MANCVHCGHELHWEADYEFEDYGREGEGIVSVWSCPHCHADHEVYIPTDYEEDINSSGE